MSPRHWLAGLTLALALPVAASAAEPTPEQLRAQLDDALRQLQAAQDRKNELAGENERLRARVAELELAAARLRLAADATHALRARAEALRAFVGRHPGLLAAFRAYVRDRLPVPLSDDPAAYDPRWPFDCDGPPPPADATRARAAYDRPA